MLYRGCCAHVSGTRALDSATEAARTEARPGRGSDACRLRNRTTTRAGGAEAVRGADGPTPSGGGGAPPGPAVEQKRGQTTSAATKSKTQGKEVCPADIAIITTAPVSVTCTGGCRGCRMESREHLSVVAHFVAGPRSQELRCSRAHIARVVGVLRFSISVPP